MVGQDKGRGPLRVRRGTVKFKRELAGGMRVVRSGGALHATPRSQPVAEKPAPARAPRQPGALKGRIHIGDDFDVLPADLLAAMEAGRV